MDKTPDWCKWMTVTMLNALAHIGKDGALYDAFRPSIVKPLRDHGLIVKNASTGLVTVTDEGRQVIEEAREIFFALVGAKVETTK